MHISVKYPLNEHFIVLLCVLSSGERFAGKSRHFIDKKNDTRVKTCHKMFIFDIINTNVLLNCHLCYIHVIA